VRRRITPGDPDGGVGLERRLILNDDLLARLSFDESDEAAGGLAEGWYHAGWFLVWFKWKGPPVTGQRVSDGRDVVKECRIAAALMMRKVSGRAGYPSGL
jgi:hypothetical protein